MQAAQAQTMDLGSVSADATAAINAVNVGYDVSFFMREDCCGLN